MLTVLLMLTACGGSEALGEPDTSDTGPLIEPTYDERACGDGTCAADESVDACPWDCGFRYVMVADLAGPSEGEYPGVDLDAVSRSDGSGGVVWAQEVVDARIYGDENAWTDPEEALGPSDSQCGVSDALVSLGGRSGYVILSFGADEVVRPGDVLTVFEYGSGMCGEGQGTDEGWELSLLNTTNPLDAVYLDEAKGLGSVEVAW